MHALNWRCMWIERFLPQCDSIKFRNLNLFRTKQATLESFYSWKSNIVIHVYLFYILCVSFLYSSSYLDDKYRTNQFKKRRVRLKTILAKYKVLYYIYFRWMDSIWCKLYLEDTWSRSVCQTLTSTGWFWTL